LANSAGVRYKSSAMRTELVVVPSTALYFVPGVLQRHEPVHVQAFIPEAAIEGFDMWIIRRCAGSGIIELDLIEVNPNVMRP
jgi:hypothetical protein